MIGETRESWRAAALALVLATPASLSCQAAFRFCAEDAGDGCDGGAGDGDDAGSDAGDSGVDAGLADGVACAADGQCGSGRCLERCCSAACATQDSDCGAVACDDAGACLYPDAGKPCGTIPPVCTSAKLDFHACDGVGACMEAMQVCPGGFACKPDGTGCATQCGPGACPDMTFCDPAQALCCPVFTGNAMHVDGIKGSDLGCCGTTVQPCQTLNRTMQMVDAFGVPGFDLIVAGGLENADAGGIDWTSAESWPVRLRLGVTLVAPNVHFVPPYLSPAFVVNDDSPADTATIGIIGQMAAPVIVGIDTQGLNLMNTRIAIDDGASEDAGHNLPLTLQNVWLNGTDAGLRVGPGASVNVGNLAIGSGATAYWLGRSMAVNGSTGISCSGSAAQPAALSAPPTGYTLLTVDSQSVHDIDSEDYCQLSLTQVTLGATSSYPGGVASCPAKIDSTGLYATGPGQLSVSALTSQCMVGYGVYLVGSDAGAPVLNAAAATIQNCGCVGAYLAGGARLVSEVTIHACQVGLQIDDDWRKVPGVFTPSSQYGYSYGSVYCNSAAEPSDLCRTRAGVDFLNTTSTSSADGHGLQWDQWSDAGTTQVWACSDRTLTTCTCEGAFCSDGGAQLLPDDADAVYLQSNTSATPFDLTGGSGISYYGCN